LIRHEISQIILQQVKDPRLRLLTVTRVQVSPDLRCAKVFVGILGEGQEQAALKGLAQAKGFIRRQLGQKLELRYIPELIFRHDKSVPYSLHITQLINGLKTHETGDQEED